MELLPFSHIGAARCEVPIAGAALVCDPFSAKNAKALFGAVLVQENLPSASSSDTLFAEALGIGIDLRLIRRLSWRNQIDEIKTGSPAFERRNVRMSSGMAVRF